MESHVARELFHAPAPMESHVARGLFHAPAPLQDPLDS